MKLFKLSALLVIVLAVGAVFIGCSGGSHQAKSMATKSTADTTATSPSRRGTGIGDTAPDFQLMRMDGASVTLADLRGAPAVLIFWTAWCPYCKKEAPRFNELAARYEPEGVRVVGINIQDSPARTEGGIRDFGIKYKVVRDADASVTRRYKVTGTPTIVFLDRDGVVRYVGNELPGDYPSRLAALVAQRG